MKSIKLSFLLIALIFLTTTSFAQNTLNPDLDIEDLKVKNLDGTYSVVTVNDDGDTQQFNVKFKKGKITSIVIDGVEVEKDNWKKNEDLILEYLDYLSPKKQKTFKYQEVYDLEIELKQDLLTLQRNIEDLEISRRFDQFYDEELKEWMMELENELNESELLKEVEDILSDVMKELDRFLLERKEYIKNK